MLVDGDKLKSMVEEYCIDKRPKSVDILKMIDKCTLKEPILKEKIFECNDYDDDSKVADTVKLNIATEVFTTMLENMESVSIKDFLQHVMWVYGLNEYDVLHDKRLL